jgi:hypothetical protein
MSVLNWAPPAQTTPTLVTNTTLFYSAAFGTTEDVIFTWPGTNRTASFTVTGGRNIRIIGGACVKSTAGSAIRFSGVTGSIFLEGLLIDMTAISADAINAGGNTAAAFTLFPDVYIQNCRIIGVNGTAAATHADAFQPQASLGRLFIDNCTIVTTYQGIFVPPTTFPISELHISRTNFAYTDVDSSLITYPLWFLNTGAPADVPYPVYLSNVYLAPRPTQNITADCMYPSLGLLDNNGIAVGALTDDSNVSGYWPAFNKVTGSVLSGAPPGGDYAAAGSVGLGYTSPGYAATELLGSTPI